MVNDFQTEFEFVLPKGYIDPQGNIHKDGIMRLATAADEIHPLKDPRVQSNPAYLAVILFSRVVTRLGAINEINPKVIENLFASDLAYLQEFYNRINRSGVATYKVNCPYCEKIFEVEPENLGE